MRTGMHLAEGGVVSPFVKGLLVGAVLYWGFQHFTGMGNTGKAKAA